jgi:hypothetical protein
VDAPRDDAVQPEATTTEFRWDEVSRERVAMKQQAERPGLVITRRRVDKAVRKISIIVAVGGAMNSVAQ